MSKCCRFWWWSKPVSLAATVVLFDPNLLFLFFFWHSSHMTLQVEFGVHIFHVVPLIALSTWFKTSVLAYLMYCIESFPWTFFYNDFFLFLSRIFLAGQSAGAHLATCALLKQAVKQVTEDPAKPSKLSWRSSQINGYLAISGGWVYTSLSLQ